MEFQLKQSIGVRACVTKEIMRTTDVAALWNSPGCDYNAGFVVVRPSVVTRQLYRTIKRMTDKSATTDDQLALNDAIGAMRRRRTRLEVAALNERRFLSGYEYFERPRRWFPLNGDRACAERNGDRCAVVVHNNWIVSKAAKIYRFREHLMWYFDGDDQYYTSGTRLYLTYASRPDTNREPRNKRREEMRVALEISALKAAMAVGHVLNRTVILPKFAVGGRAAVDRQLNSLVHVKTFDGEFSGKYRENSFLRHPKVPGQVKSGLHEQPLVIGKTFGNNLRPARRNVTVSRFDILRQFGKVNAKILAVGSLNNVNVVLGNSSDDVKFGEKLRRAVLRSNYRQDKRW